MHFLHCLSLKNTPSIPFPLLQIDIMSCKLLQCCFTEEIVAWFSCFCSSIPYTLSHRVLRQHSCYPVVRCCSNWQARLHSCITPTSRGVSVGKHMCVYFVYVLYSASMSAYTLNTDALFLLFLCKHVLAEHEVTLDFTQTQSSMQKTRQLHSITLTTTGRKHTLSQATGSGHNQRLIQ